jgi:alginate O-acetyltransferase complex protein AlgI
MPPGATGSPESSPSATPSGEASAREASGGASVAALTEDRAATLWSSIRGVLFAAILLATAAAVVARGIAYPYSAGLPFNAPLFLGFFLWFFVLYHFVAGTKDQKLWLLFVGSLMFYGSWGLQFVPLVVMTGLLDFWLAKRIAAQADRAKKRRWLLLSIGTNLLVLVAFKYTNFLLENAFAVTGLLGMTSSSPPKVSIGMPIGLSFYTFQAISYTVDVYFGKIKPSDRPHEFIAGLTFFPHLAAGPIVRSSFLLPQFEALAPPRWNECKRGFLLIATGLGTKTIADLLAFASDPVFDSADPQGALRSWTAALAFAGQVFGDFCGYTDMAAGVALLLGFSLPPNFDLPYISQSPTEFWRRWHISLSTWLRDYLWFPLALAYPRYRYTALVFVMFLGGLWHGATWSFAFWGFYQGMLLAVANWLATRFPGERHPLWLALLRWLATSYALALGFAMFRSSGFGSMSMVLREMHLPLASSSFTTASIMTLVMVLLGLVAGHALALLGRDRSGKVHQGPFLWPIVTALFAISFTVSRAGQAFIYFQF